jgi:hypothetical protein
VTVALSEDGVLLVDPTSSEEAAAQAVGSFAYRSSRDKAGAGSEGSANAEGEGSDGALTCHVRGRLSQEMLLDLLDVCAAVAKPVLEFHKQAVLHAYQ